MKKSSFKMSWSVLLSSFIILGALCALSCSSDNRAPVPPQNLNLPDLVMLSTNDRHSNFLGLPYSGYNPLTLGDGTQAGIARLKTVVDGIRAVNPNTLLFDAGDFTDGTIFFAAQSGAADLNLMKVLGYDAACLGNHEFTSGPQGLVAMLGRAQVPKIPLLCADIQFGQGASDDQLEALWGDAADPSHEIYPSIVLTTPSGIHVGVIGLIGSEVNVPEAYPVTFSVDVSSVQSLVNDLRQNQGADVAVLLIHASLSEEGSVVSGEAADIAKKVEGIDVILAGHSHTMVQATVPASDVQGSSWTTTVIEAGDEAKYLGRVNLYLDDKRKVITDKTTTDLISIDDTILGNKGMVDYGNSLLKDVEEHYLTEFPPLAGGHVFDELARAPFEIGDFNAAYLVTDAMRTASGAQLAVVSLGGDETNINRNSPDSAITVYDAFGAMHRGTGPDQLAGFALYTFYLTLKELMLILQATTAYMAQESSDYMIVPSGLKVDYDTNSPILFRVRRLYTLSMDEKTEKLIYDDSNGIKGAWIFGLGWRRGYTQDDLVSVTTTRILLYGLKELNRQLADLGAPFDPIEPRTVTGVPVAWTEPEELEQFLCKLDDTYPQAFRGKEIKAWYSVARMLAGFGGVVPSQYDDLYTDGSTHNPIGPPWRRVWDMAVHGAP